MRKIKYFKDIDENGKLVYGEISVNWEVILPLLVEIMVACGIAGLLILLWGRGIWW